MLNQSQEYMICNAIQRCGGDTGRGLCLLQSELMKIEEDKGFTKQHAVKVCTERYPKIFADEAWDQEEMIRCNMLFAEKGLTTVHG